jgi:hypothetical protein
MSQPNITKFQQLHHNRTKYSLLHHSPTLIKINMIINWKWKPVKFNWTLKLTTIQTNREKIILSRSKSKQKCQLIKKKILTNCLKLQ